MLNYVFGDCFQGLFSRIVFKDCFQGSFSKNAFKESVQEISFREQFRVWFMMRYIPRYILRFILRFMLGVQVQGTGSGFRIMLPASGSDLVLSGMLCYTDSRRFEKQYMAFHVWNTESAAGKAR
jgi:hypothetical protein